MLAFHSQRSPLLSPTAAIKKVQRLASSQPVKPEPPSEVTVLKDRIRMQHPAKLFAFSLMHMRKVAVPPVEIPRMYRVPFATSLLVGGHEVPYTRAMWNETRHRTVRRRLCRIHEDTSYN